MLTQTELKNIDLLKDAEEATFFYKSKNREGSMTVPHKGSTRRVKPVEIVIHVATGHPFLRARDLDEEMINDLTPEELEDRPELHVYRKYSLIRIKDLVVK